jgi:hypothetical protein
LSVLWSALKASFSGFGPLIITNQQAAFSLLSGLKKYGNTNNIFLILLNGVFSMSEIALISARKK